MLDRFQAISGLEPVYFYMTFAVIFGGLLALLIWMALVAGWQRRQKGEMEEGDVLNLLIRLFVLFFFFIWLITPRIT